MRHDDVGDKFEGFVVGETSSDCEGQARLSHAFRKTQGAAERLTGEAETGFESAFVQSRCELACSTKQNNGR